MARGHWVPEAVYAAGERFVAQCLLRDGSLFTPDREVWSLPVIEELLRRLILGQATNFYDRLDEQLADAPDEVRQLAAEGLYFQFLAEDDSHAPSKRASVARVLAGTDVSVPPELDDAFHGGLARVGAGKAHRPTYLRFLLRFVASWKRLPRAEHERLLTDPWAFRSAVHGQTAGSASVQAEALTHLVFPDAFEPIVAADSKRRIADTFRALPGIDAADNVDRKLHSIRAALAPILGNEFSFYRSSLRPVWQEAERSDWREYVAWAKRLYELPGFDAAERDYKLQIAEHVRTAREELDSAEWLSVLRRAFGKPNNLTSWHEHQPLLEWAEREPAGARRLLRDVWYGDHERALRGALNSLPADVITGRAARASLASLLLAGVDETRFPFFRQHVYERTCLLVGRKSVGREASVGDLYADWLSLLDELRVRLLARGVETRDRLDGQSLAWWIAQGDPPDKWSTEEKRAFLAFRDRGEGAWRPDRAWLVRGANAYGRNLVPRWLAEGFVSISDPAEPRWEPGVTFEDVVRDLSAWAGKDPAEFRNGAQTVLRFVNEMAPGHLVLTVDPDDRIYLGRVDGELEWVEGDTPGTARRRAVTWLNREAPAQRRELSDAARNLFRQNTVIELTAVGAELAALVGAGWAGAHAATAASHLDDGAGRIPRAEAATAAAMFVPEDWLNEIIDLLNEKGQVIFYGPPGTGKTYIAQRIGEHVTSIGGTYELVQFHPAYSYEDFFEGYRPHSGAGAGTLEFRLQAGPLRRIAESARNHPGAPHMLVIDEINRGNIAKILGELYFLLEYRDREITLQYRPAETFELPSNLYVIGTMNTADRSIALVDSALRRRFYFVPFLPREDPLRSVLGSWLDAHGYNDEPARLLDALNDALASAPGVDDEFAIGHSYFISRGGPPNVEHVWRHAILPLLEERFYGAKRRDEVARDFGLKTIRAQLTRDEDGEVGEIDASVEAGRDEGA